MIMTIGVVNTHTQDHSVSSLQGSTSAGISRLLQQKEDMISHLKLSIGQSESERKKHEEDVTELRRFV